MTKIYASMIALACGAFITAGAKTLTPVASINLEKAVANTTLVADDEPKAIAKTFDAKKAMKAKANADAEYIVVGTGYFYDGIFTNSEIEVTVEESASKPGYYRMNPWSVITGEEMPDFYIDCTNPDNCKIPVQDTGMEYLSGYTTEIMSYSAYCESEGITDEEFLEDPDFAPSAITMANNFIQIPEDAILASFPENEEYTEWYFLNSEMYINLPVQAFPSSGVI